MKDADNALYPGRQPGPLGDALGARVEQYYALDTPKDPGPKLSGAFGSGTASVWAETLQPTDGATKTLLSYDPEQTPANGWLAGKAAAVSRTVGRGTLIYIGAMIDPALLRSSLHASLAGTGVHPLVSGLPDGVEVRERSASGHPPVWIVMNHAATERQIVLPQPMQDLLSPEAKPAQNLNLSPHGVAILQ
jgi:beta-galactosidase